MTVNVNQNNSFIPPACMRGMYMQTMLASNKIRALGENPMVEASREMIIDAGEGVRLQGFYSPQVNVLSKGLVILFHGWEGSSSSTYVLHSGRHLYNHGYEVFRLNLRDHGDTHHLNEGLFYGTLLDEVFEAVKQVSRLSQGRSVFMAGFSLGGNFVLRLAQRSVSDPIENLRHVMAVSPALSPGRSTDAIDANRVLKWYFLKKWRRSLLRKQQSHPDLYDFSSIISLDSVRGMTDELMTRYGMYENCEEYFRGYTIGGSFLKDVQTPMTIVISRDDPAVPVDDFHRLELNANTDLCIHNYGGHNGFVYGVFSPTWYERRMVGLFDGASGEFPPA